MYWNCERCVRKGIESGEEKPLAAADGSDWKNARPMTLAGGYDTCLCSDCSNEWRERAATAERRLFESARAFVNGA